MSEPRPCPPHYWIIEPPLGPTSNGVCKKCGETKTFKNYADLYPLGLRPYERR